MALKTEQIDAEAFARWGDMKGGPLEMCRGFARAIEAEARRDALEKAETACAEISVDYWMGDAQFEAATRCRNAIRKLKEDTQ